MKFDMDLYDITPDILQETHKFRILLESKGVKSLYIKIEQGATLDLKPLCVSQVCDVEIANY